MDNRHQADTQGTVGPKVTKKQQVQGGRRPQVYTRPQVDTWDTKENSSKKVDIPTPGRNQAPTGHLGLRKISRNPVDIRTQLDTKTQVDVRPK